MKNLHNIFGLILFLCISSTALAQIEITNGSRVYDPKSDPRLTNSDHAFFAFSFIAIESLYIIEDKYNIRFGEGLEQSKQILDIMKTDEYISIYKSKQLNFCSNKANEKTIICMNGFDR